MQFHIAVEEPPAFFSDKNTLTTILQNLIVNAIKYKREADVAHQVSVEIVPKGNGIQLKVKDNGEGIKPEIQPKVFNMFYRGNKRSKGTGLGLYIVRQGTDKLGGTLQLKSKHGEGTTFVLAIPSWTHRADQ